MQIALFLLGFLLFIGLVLIHEFGHFYAAKRSGVKVLEFGLGFPPRAWAKRLKSGMLFSLNLLPLGGFVRLKGEHVAAKQPGSYGAAPLASKTKIMLGGVVMNLLAGLVLLTILAATGLPVVYDKSSAGQDQFTVARDTQISHDYVYIDEVQAGSPAASAGLKEHDILQSVTVSGHTLNVGSAQQLHELTKTLAGQVVTIGYKHEGQQRSANLQMLSQSVVQASLKSDQPKGYLGVSTTDLLVRRSTWSSPIVAVGITGQLVKLTAQGIWHALAGLGSLVAGGATGNTTARQNGQAEASNQAGGPVAVGVILWDSGSLGLSFVLVVIAVVSLTLAFINILPIPALDGGRLAVTYLYRLFKKPLKRSTEERIHGTGMAVLMVLFLLITIGDVKRYF